MSKLSAFVKQTVSPDTKAEAPKLVGTVRAIGLTDYSEEGRKGYRNVVLTIKDGNVIAFEYLEPCWTEDQAINVATGWIDTEYYRG